MTLQLKIAKLETTAYARLRSILVGCMDIAAKPPKRKAFAEAFQIKR